MKNILNEFRFPHLNNFGTVNFSFFVAIFFAIICFLFFTKTILGKKILLTGKAYEFSKFRGYNVSAYNYFTLMISGGLNSLCGF